MDDKEKVFFLESLGGCSKAELVRLKNIYRSLYFGLSNSLKTKRFGLPVEAVNIWLSYIEANKFFWEGVEYEINKRN